MPIKYKISGTKSETARIMVLKESDWSIEYNTVISGSGSYEIDDLDESQKLVAGTTDEGEMIAFGDVDPAYYYVLGDRGVFAGQDNFLIEYITISTPSNALNFGDLSASKYALGACSKLQNML